MFIPFKEFRSNIAQFFLNSPTRDPRGNIYIFIHRFSLCRTRFTRISKRITDYKITKFLRIPTTIPFWISWKESFFKSPRRRLVDSVSNSHIRLYKIGFSKKKKKHCPRLLTLFYLWTVYQITAGRWQLENTICTQLTDYGSKVSSRNSIWKWS